jgi:hypothetical protein
MQLQGSHREASPPSQGVSSGPNITAFHDMMFSGLGDPFTPCGGSCCRRLKSRMSRCRGPGKGAREIKRGRPRATEEADPSQESAAAPRTFLAGVDMIALALAWPRPLYISQTPSSPKLATRLLEPIRPSCACAHKSLSMPSESLARAAHCGPDIRLQVRPAAKQTLPPGSKRAMSFTSSPVPAALCR